MTSSSVAGTYSFTLTSDIYYGPNTLSTSLPKLLSRINSDPKVLILTGKSLATKTDVIKKITSVLGDKHVATFTDIGEHAPEEGVRAALKLMNEKGANVIVAVGGGSPIDSAKAISFWNKNEEKKDWIRSIAIPTTLSAAEFTGQGGYTKDGKKTGVSDPEIVPKSILLDAELTLSTPERLWLSTGMRALDHAIEALYRPYAPPPVKAMAYAAIQDLFKYLPACKDEPENVEIRQKLQIAAWQSMWPYKQEPDAKSSFGKSHGLGYALGSPYKIPHGITSCITLGSVVKWQAKHGSEEDKQWLAKVLWYLDEKSTGDLEKDVTKVGELIDKLVDRLGLTTKMSESGVPEGDVAKVVDSLELEGDKREDMIKLLQAKF